MSKKKTKKKTKMKRRFGGTHCIAYSSGQHTVEFGVLCMSKELSQSLENLGGAQTLPGRFSVPSISGIYTRHKRTR